MGLGKLIITLWITSFLLVIFIFPRYKRDWSIVFLFPWAPLALISLLVFRIASIEPNSIFINNKIIKDRTKALQFYGTLIKARLVKPNSYRGVTAKYIVHRR